MKFTEKTWEQLIIFMVAALFLLLATGVHASSLYTHDGTYLGEHNQHTRNKVDTDEI